MKFVPNRPYSDPEKAARKLLEIANSVEAVQDGKIYIELISTLGRPSGNRTSKLAVWGTASCLIIRIGIRAA